jgi:hypothetical protein
MIEKKLREMIEKKAKRNDRQYNTILFYCS